MLCLVILCGGKGTRLKNVIRSKSKTLVKINRKELLTHILDQFKNIKNKYFLVNKNQHDVVNYLNKKNYSKNILIENSYLGDGGCLSSLKKIENFHLHNFLVVSGDLLINADISKFVNFHNKHKSKLTLWCHPTDHAKDSDLLKYDNKYKLTNFFKKPHKKNNIGNISATGIYLINGDLLKYLPKKLDNYPSRNFFKRLNNKKISIYCYNSRDFIKDAGTPYRLKYLRKLIKKERFQLSNTINKMGAIFLDRDGVVNKENNNKKFPSPMDMFQGTFRAIKRINNSKYLCIIITNQSAVAKGFLTEKKLNQLHDKFKMTLSKNNCYVDEIYYCPHHPHKGFKGEIKKYKKICGCRKPKVGLFKKAIGNFNIDIKRSIFIGNSYTDYLAAKKLKIKYFHIGRKNIIGQKLKSFSNLNKVLNKVI